MTSEQSSAMLRLGAFAAALAAVFVLAFAAGNLLDPVGEPAPATPNETSQGDHDEHTR